MKSVEAEDSSESVSLAEPAGFELEMRRMARVIFAETFPNEQATAARIEAVAEEIVVVDDDGFVDDAIAEEKENLIYARKWANEAYGDHSPEATFIAYDVLFGATRNERHWEIIERLDKLTKKK